MLAVLLFSLPLGNLEPTRAQAVTSCWKLGLLDRLLATVRRPQPSGWIVATDGSATPASVVTPAMAGWGFVAARVGLMPVEELAAWGEVLVDDRDPRALGADELTNNAAELWALAEAFLWLRDESGDDGSLPVTLVYDSEFAIRASRLSRGPRNRTLG